MIILGISTSTAQGSIALTEGQRVLAAVEYIELRAHAERLFPMLNQACALAALDKRAIGLVACDIGPGSFTGVRVGVAAATGIGMSLGIPTLGVRSLDAMAAARFELEGLEQVELTLDAGKGEVYTARYHRDEALRVELAGAIALGRPTHARLTGASVELPHARFIAQLAAWRLQRGVAEPGPLDPCYVRAPDATLPATPSQSAQDANEAARAKGV